MMYTQPSKSSCGGYALYVNSQLDHHVRNDLSAIHWKPHLVELSGKLSRSVGIFYKLRHYVAADTLKTVYYALFYPFLTYGITVWGATYDKFRNPVRIAQKKVVRAMTFSEPTAHSLFHDLKLLNFDDLHELLIAVFVYECHNNFAPSYFADYFTQTSHIHSHNTRSAARGDFFMVRKILRNMACAPLVSMEQRSGITFFLKSEILHL